MKFYRMSRLKKYIWEKHLTYDIKNINTNNYNYRYLISVQVYTFMRLSLQVKLDQTLSLSPQLQQAIRLLQLSSAQLQNEIQQALESNIMLETTDDNSDSDSLSNDVTSANEPSDSEDTELITQPEDFTNTEDMDSDYESTSDVDYYKNSYSGDKDFQSFLENKNISEKTLREHLLWQLNLTNISDADKIIALALIDALDDNGYLECDLDDIYSSLKDKNDRGSETTEIDRDDIEVVLHMIQAFEPAGVAARNLQECLLLQLRQYDQRQMVRNMAIELVTTHIDLLAKKNYSQIMKQLKIDQQQLQEVMSLIQSMHPHPGRKIHETPTEYITPDIYVKKIENRWQVEMSPGLVPNLRINTHYANMIHRADNSQDRDSLKTHLQEAKWFIKSLQNRNHTLLRVTKCIVDRQWAFFEHGEEAMKPMILKDIAKILGMHESTISRATTHKYMHTPRGIFELKYFFSSQLATNRGGTISSIAIQALIKKIIAHEPPDKPLSDDKISLLLKQQGISTARRTVAKYRESMAIAPSHERKRLV